MTIKAKLVIASSIFFFVSITLMGIGLYIVKDLTDALTFVNYAGQTRYKTYRLAWLIEEYLEGKRESEAIIRKEMYDLERLLLHLRDGSRERNLKRPGDTEILLRLNRHIEDWYKIKALIEKDLKATVYKSGEWVDYVLFEDYVSGLDATVSLAEKKEGEKGAAFVLKIYLVAVLSIFLFFAFLFYIYMEITTPLGNMIKGIRNFSQGNLKTRIDAISKDELGEVASSFNEMAGNLENLYDRLNSTVDQLTVANIKLERTNIVRNNIVTIVSHELLTPLTSIKGFVHTLMREDAKFDEVVKKKYLSIIGSEADRLSKMISEMMDMTRIEMGRMELTRELVSVARIIRDAVSMLNISDIEFDLKEDIQDVWLDKDKTQEVILNIIDNAVKYSPKDGRIRIKAYEEKGFIKVTVDDEGPGIGKEDREKIFDAFYRLSEGLKKNKTGLGLGLYICKGIVGAHNGQIWIEEKEGKGTRVAFTLHKENKYEQSPNIDS